MGRPLTDLGRKAFVVRLGEGRSIDLGGFLMTVKATNDDTARAFSLLEADEPPGFGPPLHIHHNAAEAFYVLEGEYVIFLGDDEIPCPAATRRQQRRLRPSCLPRAGRSSYGRWDLVRRCSGATCTHSDVASL